MELFFEEIVQEGWHIADLGCGAKGSEWYHKLPENCVIDGYDLFFPPNHQLNNFNFFQEDVTKLYNISELKNKYDLVVADNIFEHVKEPEELAYSINHILKMGGLTHIGIPDSTNITDKLYRLIHPDGGGHIQQFTRGSFISLMNRNGFDLVNMREWPDDWTWLSDNFSLDDYNVSHLTNSELQFIAKVLKKEFTLQKGYFYGWELMFVKVSEESLQDFINRVIEKIK